MKNFIAVTLTALALTMGVVAPTLANPARLTDHMADKGWQLIDRQGDCIEGQNASQFVMGAVAAAAKFGVKPRTGDDAVKFYHALQLHGVPLPDGINPSATITVPGDDDTAIILIIEDGGNAGDVKVCLAVEVTHPFYNEVVTEKAADGEVVRP